MHIILIFAARKPDKVKTNLLLRSSRKNRFTVILWFFLLLFILKLAYKVDTWPQGNLAIHFKTKHYGIVGILAGAKKSGFYFMLRNLISNSQ